MKQVFSRTLFFFIFLLVFATQYKIIHRAQHYNPGYDYSIIWLSWMTVGGFIALPFTISSWSFGFRSARFRKTLLAVAVVVLMWPVLIIISMIPDILKTINEVKQAEKNQVLQAQAETPLLDRSSITQLTETPIMFGEKAIGVHIDMQLEVPNEWLVKHEPICAKHTTYRGGFDARLGQPGQLVILQSTSFKTMCYASANSEMTSVHFTSDFYPPALLNVSDNNTNICIQPHELNSVGLAEKGFFLFILGINIQYPQDPAPSAFKTQITNKIPMLRDYAFWLQSERNIMPEHLQADGYKPCHLNEKKDGDLGAQECYCR